MAWFIKLCILPAVLIRTVITDPVVMIEGNYYTFDMAKKDLPNSIKISYCLVSRSSTSESLVLWNTSNSSPEKSTLPAELRHRLVLVPFQSDEYWGTSVRINRLVQSDSGQYRRECWTDGRMSYQRITDLLVCSDYNGHQIQYVDLEQTVKLQCEVTRDGEDMTVQWSRGTRSAGWLQLTEISSSLEFNITSENMDVSYPLMCAVLEGELCFSAQSFRLKLRNNYVIRSAGEEAELTCRNQDDPMGRQTNWWYKSFRIRWESNNLTRRGKPMYVTDGRRSGNYSLVIPSLMLNHTERYLCMNGRYKFIEVYELLVLPKAEPEPLTVFFSEGQAVVLRCNSNLTQSVRVVWYRQTAEVDYVFLDTNELGNVPRDLVGRMNASDPSSFLVLSNLSLADIGEYWCAVFYKEVCVSVTKTLLLEWDPFGINSTFYMVYFSLMDSALLGMVCILNTVNLKTRRRNQASLQPRHRGAAE